MIIGLVGKAGAGKDAVAKVLTDVKKFRLEKMAAPLYEMVGIMTGLSFDELQDRDTKERVIPSFSKSPRELLQSLGTDWGRAMVCQDIWVKAIDARCRDCENIVISDVRFDNECEWIKSRGGVIWEVTRPCNGCSLKGKSTDCHKSEQGVSREFIDETIKNSGTLEALALKVLESYRSAC